MLDLEELTADWLAEDGQSSEAITQMTDGLIDYLLQSDLDALELYRAIAEGSGISTVAKRIAQGITHVISETLYQALRQGKFTPPENVNVSDLEI